MLTTEAPIISFGKASKDMANTNDKQNQRMSTSNSSDGTLNKSKISKERLMEMSIVTQARTLKSMERGSSEIEQMAERVETRRSNRLVVTFPARVAFLKQCRAVAEQTPGSNDRVNREQLLLLRDAQKHHVDSINFESILQRTGSWFGFRNVNYQILGIYERAIQRVDEIEGDWIYFKDFTFDETKLEPYWPWMREGRGSVFFIIVGFYLFTAILFCNIIGDKGVCPSDPKGERWYYGWVSALYFASTTMSTVGYGDLTVEKDEDWKIFIGSIYMILAIVVAFTAFSRAANSAYYMTISRLDYWTERVLSKLTGHSADKKMLHQHMRFIKYVKMTEVFLQIGLFMLVGMFVSRLFVKNAANDEKEEWSWMTSFYWATQTTTTIGYGDLSMTFQMRWFQIVYLAFSTVFVGNAFGKLADLHNELESVKKYYVWQRRQVSKRMIEEYQAYEHDDRIDQYEFVLASLLMLDKISSSDITPIMDKFRLLAGSKGYIAMDEGTSPSEQGSVRGSSSDISTAHDLLEGADIEFCE